VLHTLRGAAVNEPLGIALAAAIEADVGLRVDRLYDDDSVSVAVPLADRAEAEAALRAALAGLALPESLGGRIREGLERSGAFGAAFRENAGRALLLPRQGFGKRTPLWVTRLRAKRLYEKTAGFADFPIAKETWKSVLEGRFDMAALSALCAGLSDGSVGLSVFSPRAPSPFARQSGWAETNRYLYEGDEMPGRKAQAQGTGRLSAGDEAIRAAVAGGSSRPRVDPELALAFGRKLRRELPGWAPETPEALADWVDERVAIPLPEWEALLAACPPELARAAASALAASGEGEGPGPGEGGSLLHRLRTSRFPGASVDAVVRKERLAALGDSPLESPARLAAEWLRSTGPVPIDSVSGLFGLGCESGLAALEAAGAAIVPDLAALGGPAGLPGACDGDVLESLFRQARKAARPAVKALPASDLPSFFAAMQGLRDRASEALDAATGAESRISDEEGIEATRRALLPLSGFPAAAALWETEILPARVRAYRPEYLDALLSSGEFLWYGAGRETVAFVRAEEFEAFAPRAASALLGPGDAPEDAWAVKDRLGLSIAELEERMWAEIWSGAIGSEGFEAVRRAAAAGFARVSSRQEGDAGAKDEPARAGGRRGRVPAALRGRWKSGAPVPGRWFALELEDDRDEADRLELAAVAARASARRFGIVCKATLEREAPGLGWSSLGQAVRRLELSGEFVWGRFFEGLDGP
ncbi:MAG: hypothetical protein KKB59_02865, partial [Spirochaetes bacterium]|nr:hypothetical protein [Spirochaetota bacterium]